jgi:hypothetical protein
LFDFIYLYIIIYNYRDLIKFNNNVMLCVFLCVRKTREQLLLLHLLLHNNTVQAIYYPDVTFCIHHYFQITQNTSSKLIYFTKTYCIFKALD